MITTQEQKNTVRDWFARSVETLPREIEKEIEAVGGEDMLIQRMDTCSRRSEES